ncbi:hypothetical protein SO802_034403 [Lithocarpus litseifolius]|uniref:Uncharacterized protein n=1 Tax=Lithocarpus litseifolius TaxID=425828 RepID=A0AAW2BH25_9ROSI
MAAELKPLACHRAVQFATEIILQEVIFKGDAEVLIKMPQQNEFHGNFVAHALARRAKRLADMQIWIEEVPENLNPIILYDVQ